MKLPKIDNRTATDIAERIKDSAPFYTPQWSPKAPEDAGAALAGIFGDMVFEVIHRLNRVPERHLAAFLDLLGLVRIPPQPAETVVAFTLAKDAKENVLVPSGTQVSAAKTEEHDELVFETQENVVSTPAKITALYSVIPDRKMGNEKIYCHTGAFTAGERFEIFHGGTNLQEHALYLRQADLFSAKSGVRITLVGLPAPFAAGLGWFYTGKDGKSRQFAASYDGGNIVLTTAAGHQETAESTVNGVTGFWIRAIPVAGIGGKSALLSVKDSVVSSTVMAGAASITGTFIYPEQAYAGDVPMDLTRGVGDTFKTTILPFGEKPMTLATFYVGNREVLSKKGARVTLDITSLYAGNITVERVQGIGETYSARLKAAGINTASDVLMRSDMELAEAIRNKAGGSGLGSYLLRAKNIREATAKEYYDKTGIGGGLPRALAFPTAGLSWEYHNGEGWTAIPDVADTTLRLLVSGTVSFTCPLDMAPTKVAGQENHWVRVRLVSGNYGKELDVVDGQVIPAGFTPPMVRRITMAYSHQSARFQKVEAVVSHNNLQWDDGLALLNAGKQFWPFRMLDEDRPTFYLGFDRPITGGPIGLFFSLVEQDYPRDFRPVVRWDVWNPAGKQWEKVDAEDGTSDFTRGGVVRLMAQQEGETLSRFGRNLYWLRAVVAKGEFTPLAHAANTLLAAGQVNAGVLAAYFAFHGRLKLKGGYAVTGWTGALGQPASCMDALAGLPDMRFSPAALRTTPPLVRGVYVNAAKAIHLVTVVNEPARTGNGLPGQAFTLSKTPVFEEEVWVNEMGAIPKAERDTIRAKRPTWIREVSDREGKDKEVWVRWDKRVDLLESGPDDRHYALDRSTGEITFGDGKQGRVLPAMKNNLKVSYRTGGGTAGNIKVGEIGRIKTAIPLVDKAKNPEAAGGGVDQEALDAVYRRGPHSLRHKNRAVTAKDYERLIMESFPGMARVRCLPVFDDEGRTKTGWVTVLLVPQSKEERPLPSVQLLRRVEEFLSGHAANVVTAPRHAVVSRPSYLEVSVTTRLVPENIDLAPSVETAAMDSLRKFLHPLTGGWSGAGWFFGRMACRSDLHALLEKVPGVDRVGALELAVTGETGIRRELDAGGMSFGTLPPWMLISSGEHKVEAR